MEFTQAKISNKKKFSLKFLFLIFIVILLLYAIYWICFKETPFLNSESPNKVNKIEINEYGNSLWNGAPKINIYFKNHADKVLDKQQIKVGNKMRENGKDQYKITWTNDEQVKITMRYEHATEIVTYNFRKKELRQSSTLERNF
ncbi:hypothetical protein ABE112_23590 [Priestia aryabhattai]|uniref:hypothetical protein n=1 Tax=Priestia aryabhattai TaxID=412384 RepID=UPI002E224943|nr:hypothetical protein [Priestia aryabhattai]